MGPLAKSCKKHKIIQIQPQEWGDNSFYPVIAYFGYMRALTKCQHPNQGVGSANMELFLQY